MPLPTATTAADTGRRALLSVVPALLALPVDLAGRSPDPVHAAIAEAREAREAFMSALDALNEAERDAGNVQMTKVALRAADEAADRDSDARAALASARPITREGLHALIRFHAEDIAYLEPQTSGAVALREISDLLPPPPEPRPVRRRSLLSRLALLAGEIVTLAAMCGGGAAVSRLPHLAHLL